MAQTGLQRVVNDEFAHVIVGREMFIDEPARGGTCHHVDEDRNGDMSCGALGGSRCR
jgi:hypothetical protein